jgi:TldD protein
MPIGSEMPVVLAGGWGGVWLHEVVGHLLEADVAADCSAPGALGAERIGLRVANDSINVFDDATLDAARGTARVDDEGTPTRRNTLIEEGILTSLLTDRATACRLGLPETGNGRRQDYRHEPLPRMSNLLLEAGDADPESLVNEARTGIFVKMIGNGAVVPEEDSFSFEILEGYAIESGRIGRPVRGRLSGRPSEMLTRIRGIANDFQYDAGRGICSKNGQVVPVSVGMPTVLIDMMTVNPLS